MNVDCSKCGAVAILTVGKQLCFLRFIINVCHDTLVFKLMAYFQIFYINFLVIGMLGSYLPHPIRWFQSTLVMRLSMITKSQIGHSV